MRKCLALSSMLVAIVLAGCTTAAQRQAQAIASNNQEAAAILQSCTRAVYDSAGFEPLRAHVPLNPDQLTLEQLADTNLATDGEIKAILLLHPAFQACSTDYLNQIALTTPTLVPIFATMLTRRDEALVGAIQKTVSWGEYLTQVRELLAEARTQGAEEGRRIAAGLEQSHQAELVRRQAAADALMRYSQTQRIINNMNRPVFTNCIGGAGMVNCVSQ